MPQGVSASRDQNGSPTAWQRNATIGAAPRNPVSISLTRERDTSARPGQRTADAEVLAPQILGEWVVRIVSARHPLKARHVG